MSYLSQIIRLDSNSGITIHSTSTDSHSVWLQLGTTNITFMLDTADQATLLKTALEACKPLPKEAAHAS